MASRRVGQKAIDWAAFAERVPPSQKSQFNALKGRSDALKARYNATPAEPPALDWEMYRRVITVPGLVDKFEKQYTATKIPYPNDPMTAQIDAQEKEFDKQVVQITADAKKRIAEYEEQAKKFTGMVPWEEMTVEEYEEYFPENSVKARYEKYPHWPHLPDRE